MGGTASHLSNNTSTDKARSMSSIEARFPKVALVNPQRGHRIDVRGADLTICPPSVAKFAAS
jgi:hypothetical protein